VVKASYDASMPTLRRACTENTRTEILEAIKEWAFDVTKPKIYWMNGKAVNSDIKLYLSERFVDMVDGRSDFEDSADDWPPEDKLDILTHQSSGCSSSPRPSANTLKNMAGISRSVSMLWSV
jgi:hypothetical protein